MDKYLKAINSDVFSEKEVSHIKGVYDFANLICDLKENTNLFSDYHINAIGIEVNSLYATMDVSKRDFHPVVFEIFCFDEYDEANDYHNKELKEKLFSVNSPIQNIYASLMPPSKYTYSRITLTLDDTLKDQIFEKLIDPTFNKMIEVRLLDNELKTLDGSSLNKSTKRKI